MSIRETLPNYPAVGQLFDELENYLSHHEVKKYNHCAAIWHDCEYKESDVDGEAVLFIYSPGREICRGSYNYALREIKDWCDGRKCAIDKCSKEQCDCLFDLYFRSSQIRNSLELGLGLYLCRKIIIAHGGEIGVVSSKGAGAKFWFTIPLAE